MKKLLWSLSLFVFTFTAQAQSQKLGLPWATPAPAVSAPEPQVAPKETPAYVLPPGIRQPNAMELASIPIPMTPSASPVSPTQHEAQRLQIWEQQERARIQAQQAAQRAHEEELRRPQVVVVQQPDPLVSGIMTIPRLILGAFLK